MYTFRHGAGIYPCHASLAGKKCEDRILFLPAELGHGIIDCLDDDVNFLLGNDQRRDKAQHVAVG